MTTAKCPSCGAERVDVKGRGNAACAACNAAFNPLPLAFATLKRAGVDGAKLQHILGTEGKKLHKCVSCSEMLTTFPVLGETLHACVPCQSVWLANGAMERFHRVAVGAGKENQPVSTATMQMAVANVSPPPPAPPAPPPLAPPPPGASAGGFGTGPSTLMMASAAPGSAEPSTVSKAPAAAPAIEASLDPPESLDPPLDVHNPPSAKSKGGGMDPILPPPAKSDPSAKAPSTAPPVSSPPAAAPGSSTGMKPPPTSKPFNLTSGAPPADVASAADAKKAKTGEIKKADKTGEVKKPDKTGENKKPDKKDKTGEHKKPLEKGDKKPPPTLYVEENSGSSGLKAAALLVMVLVAAFVAWRYMGSDSLTRVGGGKGARFGQEQVLKENIKVGERLASKVTAERPGGDLVVWYFPNADVTRGATAMLIEVLGDKVHFQAPRNYDEMTVLNGELRQGDKSGRVRAFFKGEEAWVLVAMSKSSAFATSEEGEAFLSSLADFKK